MGVMTALVLNHIVNPLEGLFAKWNKVFISIGYARAASELARQGLYAEAQALMTEKLQHDLEK